MEDKNEKFDVTPQMLFDSGAQGYLNNSLKIMNGKFGGGFYVKFLQDVGSKMGWLMLIIVYPDGQYKSVVLYKNLFKQTDFEGENMEKVLINGKEVPLKLEDSLEKGDYGMLEKFETPKMPIPAKTLWKLIMDNYEKIPVTTIYHTEDIEGVYWELYRIAHEIAISDMQKAYRENEVRFLVTKEEMENIAIENGMSLAQLRTELNLLGLLIKDKGSCSKQGKRYNSYQLTKKVDGITERFYAIKKGVNNRECTIDESCAVEFSTELSQTNQEIELKDAKEKINRLEKLVQEKDQKIKEVYLNRVDDVTQKELYEELI